MKIYTAIRKGEMHPVFCEDFLISKNIGGNYYLGAVMDGCSSGKDSHFASALTGKLLSKIALDILPKSDENAKTIDICKLILKELFVELKGMQNTLRLETNELLSTLILLLYNQKIQEACIIAIGDGYLAINGKITEIDQNNMPEYLAYYLDENFEDWFDNQQNIFVVQNPTEICISSDGIGTFQSLLTGHPEEFDPIEYLLLDNYLENNPQMLGRKCNILQSQYGYKPADDLSVIRVNF